MSVVAKQYERRGFLAIDPAAFGMMFMMGPDATANRDVGVATIVTISGPLESQAGWGWDSYDGIRDRVAAALAAAAPVVLLELSSPGGDAAGCFELARWIRASAEPAGKRVVAYVRSRACSAAYAIACGASEIVLSDSALVGSIGILATRMDYSARNAANGVAVAFIGSGARKADGNPDQPITPDELAAQQRIVDSMAAVFFDVVREARGIDASELQAGVFHGAEAISRGLADRQLPLDELLVSLGGNPMGAMDEARKALKGLAEGDGDEKERDAAKRALAALDEERDPGAEDDTEAEGEDDEEPKPKPKPEPEGKSAEAAAAYKKAGEAMSEVQRLRAELAERDANAERERIIATRPDLTADFVDVLRKLPVVTVRDLVAKTPRVQGGVSAGDALASTGARPTRGEDTSSGAGRLPPTEKLELDKRMGLTTQSSEVVQTPYSMVLGATVSKATAGAGVKP